MLKTNIISIDKPIVNDSSSFTHSGTSYQVSKLPIFTDAANIIVDVVNDTVNLLSYRFEYDLGDNQPLYIRTKYHFNTTLESNWSKIMPLNNNQVGIKLSNTIINTPIVTLETTYTVNSKALIITSSPFELFGGLGNHLSTSYIITDTDNKVYFERTEDVDNLLSIEVDMDTLPVGNSYIIKVRHHTDTNAFSNYGKSILMTNTIKDTLFEMNLPYYFVPKRHIWFDIKLYTPNYSSTDIIITDKFDIEVASNLDQNTNTPTIYTGNLTIGNFYKIKARIKYLDGTYSNYRTIYSNIVSENLLMSYDTSINYLAKYDFTHYINTNNATVQTSYESYSNGILLGKNNDNNIYRYNLINGELQEQEVAFTLNNITTFDKQFMNFVPLHNSRLLVDYSSGLIDGEYRKPIFQVYTYNVITQQFTFLHELLRDTERYSTAISSSTAPTVGDIVYYIPAKIVDDNNVEQPLTLNYYDANNNVVQVASALPVTIKRFGSLVSLGGGKLLFLGGVLDPLVTPSSLEYERANQDVYTYDIPTDVWTKVTTLPSFIPLTVYNLEAYRRKDNRIILFNGSEDGVSVGNQDTYVYNMVLNTITLEANDTGDDLRYNNSILLQNGDIMRISSRTLDPQKAFTYISNTKAASDILDNVTIDVIEDLVVELNTTLTIESPYRYKTITIKGTSVTDTGLLRWIEGDVVYEFRYRDLLVTQPTEVTNNLYDPVVDWDTITILDGASFSANNVIWTPDNTTFTISSDFIVSEILLGVNSELIVTD